MFKGAGRVVVLFLRACLSSAAQTSASSARGVAAAYGPLTGPLGWRFYAPWQAVPPARPLGLTGLGSVVPAAQIFGLRVRGLAPPGKLTGRWAKGQLGAGCFTSFVEHERGGTARSTGHAFFL